MAEAESGAKEGEGDKKIVHTYPLVKVCVNHTWKHIAFCVFIVLAVRHLQRLFIAILFMY